MKSIIENGIKYEVKEGYYPNGKIQYQYWYRDGQWHRDDDKPAYIGYYESGKIEWQYWYKNGQWHRNNDKPACIKYYENGKIEWQHWYKNGQWHRDNDKPACIGYYKNDKVRWQEWYKNGQWYRDNDKPACIEYYENGKIECQQWFKNGQWHRDSDKPACIGYYKNGKIKWQHWYKYGVEVTEQFCKNKKWENIPVKRILKEPNTQRRMMLIKLKGIEKIAKESKVLEEISGIELYSKYPIGDYYQQGDVLVKPEPIEKVNFEEVDEKTKVRLSKIKYKLIQIDKFKYLQMNNASHPDLIHIEGVVNEIKSVFEAICFRNKVDYLPMALS